MMDNKPMQGLMGMMQGIQQPQQPMNDVASLVEQAVALHEGHMSGLIPTTPESQQQLMDLLLSIQQGLM